MKHLEDNLQEACVRWFRLQYPNIVIFAIPNGGYRNSREAARLKKTGVLPGVADLFIMKDKYPPPWDMSTAAEAYHGLFIELKTGKNKQTAAQKAFEAKCKAEGYQYKVCRYIEEFIEEVNNYL